MQPQMPMQGSMGMMPPSFGGRGQMMGMNQMPRNPMMNPFMGGMQQMNRGGGFLSRMFGRGNPTGGLNRFMGMPQAGQAVGGSGSFLQSLSNPGGISNFLNNTQQVIKTAQSIGPMFQQYGPIIKNLPAMWKLYRGLKNAPGPSEEKENQSADTKKSKPKETKASIESKDESSTNSKQTKASRHRNQNHRRENKRTGSKQEKGTSIPKLYI